MPNEKPWAGLDPDLLEREGFPTRAALEAWDAPLPAPELTDRIVAAVQVHTVLPTIERLYPMETAVQPTPTDRNTLLLTVAVGFAIAAAVLLAFWAGRASVTPPVAPQTTGPETQAVVSPEASVALPPPLAEMPEVLDVPQVRDVVAVPPAQPSIPIAKPDGRAHQTRASVGGELRPTQPQHDLKNPFGSSKSDSKRDSKRGSKRGSVADEQKNLKNPFSNSDDPPAKTATIRVGVVSGKSPAHVTVDDESVGTTPIEKVAVVPGRHKIIFSWPNGATATRFVTVDDGEVVLVRQ